MPVVFVVVYVYVRFSLCQEYLLLCMSTLDSLYVQEYLLLFMSALESLYLIGGKDSGGNVTSGST